jgi:hypothetical protein
LDATHNDRGVAEGGMARIPDLLKEYIYVTFATDVTRLINMAQAILPIFLK